MIDYKSPNLNRDELIELILSMKSHHHSMREFALLRSINSFDSGNEEQSWLYLIIWAAIKPPRSLSLKDL